LINALSNNKKLAHVSKKPGKTRSLNFFKVSDKFVFVDVPGYGYAKVSMKQKVIFTDMID
jgi:GTP-binding protein